MAEFDPATGGYKTEAVSGNTVAIEVTRKNSGFARGIGKLFAFVIGGIGVLVSALLFVTIIGILPGIGLFFTSLGIIALGLGKQQVACPHCKRKQTVLKTALNFTCAKCRQLTVINWK